MLCKKVNLYIAWENCVCAVKIYRIHAGVMPDQNIMITQEHYKSKAYVWRIVRLGYTFPTAPVNFGWMTKP